MVYPCPRRRRNHISQIIQSKVPKSGHQVENHEKPMKSRIPTTEARRSTDTDIPLASASRTTDLQDIQYQPSLSGKLEKELEVQSSHKLNGWIGSEMLLAV